MSSSKHESTGQASATRFRKDKSPHGQVVASSLPFTNLWYQIFANGNPMHAT
jgi:hypothetical protein